MPDGSRLDGALRPLDPDRDLLVITTDSSAPATVRVDLAKLIATLIDYPGFMPLSAAGVTAHAPGPATDLAAAIWAFTELRNETTYQAPQHAHPARRMDRRGFLAKTGKGRYALLELVSGPVTASANPLPP